MKATIKSVLVALIGGVLLYGLWAAVRAQRDLVTLNVRDMDVRQVVKKIERQTWENIFVHQDVQGQVTLNVRRLPLGEVLRIIGDQTGSGCNTIYSLQAQQQHDQRFRHMQSLTPDQRRTRVAQMDGGTLNRFNLERLKNTTPEQRVEQYRRMAQMRQRMRQGHPPPSPPGPAR